MTHQALALQIGKHRERRFDRAFRRAMDVEHDVKVDHVDHVAVEIAAIVVNRLDQLFARVGWIPRPIRRDDR
ncbi:hypothetical protein V1291_004938 [Nitrobacteraceae bacterium AZCC 1564]